MSIAEFQAQMDVGPDVVSDLVALRSEVLTWNQQFNLVGPSFEQDFWRRHALDSAQLFHVEHLMPRWADVGSGAGFPGLVIAILMKWRGAGEIQLIESVGKRVAFLRAMREKLALPTVVHHGRAEQIQPIPIVDVVTARACAPLDRLLGYTEAMLQRGTCGLFLKGQGVDKEVEDARANWSFTAELLPSLSSPSGSVLRVTNLARR